MKPDFAWMREHFLDKKAIVVVGGRAFVAYPYREERPIPEGVAFYHVADNAEAFGREHAADLALLGDIGATLADGAQTVSGERRQPRRSRRGSRPAARRRRAPRTTRCAPKSWPSKTPAARADAAVLAALDALPEDALIANDSAATFGAVQDLLTTRPAAISSRAAACSAATCRPRSARRWRPATGSPRSSATAARCIRRRRCGARRTTGRNVMFFVFNNRRYGVLQNVARWLGYANAVAGRFVGMEIIDPAIDFAALAKSMGTPYARADDRAAMLAAFAEAATRNGPTLIEIPVR